MKNREHVSSIQHVISNMKEQLVRWQTIAAHFVATEGLIIDSSDFSEDGEPGRAIMYRFATLKNEVVEARFQSTIHWPGEEGWEEYAKRMSVGATVSVLYDPDNPSDSVAFIDIPTLERSIEAARKQLQALEMSSHPK